MPARTASLLVHARPDKWREPWLMTMVDGAITTITRPGGTPPPRDNRFMALHWAGRGLYVFPCGANKKPKPGIKWRDQSTTDREQIEAWWRRWSDALPAIDLAKSGHVVVDGDRHGGPDGVTAVQQLFAEHATDLAKVPTIVTPSNGRHYWFVQPAGEPLGNSDKAVRGDGVNIRGAGGYVIAPGAQLPDGRRYARDHASLSIDRAFRDGTVPVLPGWLVKLLRANGHDCDAGLPSSSNGAARLQTDDKRGQAYAAKALGALAYNLTAMPAESGRNIALNNAALQIGHLIASGWIGRTTVEGRLFDASLANGLVRDTGANAVRATIKSGLDAGMQEPHKALPDRPDRVSLTSGQHQAVQPIARQLVVHRASDVQIEPVEWLWPGRAAIGKQTLIAGEAGLGKSQVTVGMAATVTRAGQWPCTEAAAPLGSVLFLSAEDSMADTIVPRLLAADADLARVHIVSAVRAEDGKGRRAFNLQADLDLLERKLAEIGDVRLIVIDPISSYMGPKLDSHVNAAVRGVLEPVGELATRMRVAIVSITHPPKGTGTAAINRFIGSVAFVAAARSAFMVTRDAEDETRRLFLPVKNNLAPLGHGLAFRLEQRIVGPANKAIVASAVAWESTPVTVSADEALRAAAAGDHERDALGEATEFLRDKLGAGPVPVREVDEHARALGIAKRTIERARKSLQVRAIKTDLKGGWSLALPEQPKKDD